MWFWSLAAEICASLSEPVGVLAGGQLANGRAEVHDSFSSEAAFAAAFADSSKGGGGFQPGAPPPGVLKEVDQQEINRIFVRSDRLNRCALQLQVDWLNVSFHLAQALADEMRSACRVGLQCWPQRRRSCVLPAMRQALRVKLCCRMVRKPVCVRVQRGDRGVRAGAVHSGARGAALVASAARVQPHQDRRDQPLQHGPDQARSGSARALASPLLRTGTPQYFVDRTFDPDGDGTRV